MEDFVEDADEFDGECDYNSELPNGNVSASIHFNGKVSSELQYFQLQKVILLEVTWTVLKDVFSFPASAGQRCTVATRSPASLYTSA